MSSRSAAVAAAALLLGACGTSKPSAAPTTTSPTVLTTMIGGVPTSAAIPKATTTTTSGMLNVGAFVGTWGAHFGAFTIHADGTGTGSWRVYRWCSDSPTPPCDAQVNNDIVNGGNADLRISAVHGDVAFAEVLHTSDPARLPKGDVSLTLVPGDQLQIGALGAFCGPRAAVGACGA